jgi:glycosyltransferase involved in cell wall biosynthesis
MPSVLFVLQSHICGGIEKHLLTVMRGLAGRGYRTAFAGPADSWLMDQVRAHRLSGYHLPMHGMFDLWSVLRLVALARRVGADLIHSHATRGARYARFAGALTGMPVVSTAHSTNAGKHFGGANRIIAVSNAVADFLASCGYDRERVLVIHNGVPDFRGVRSSRFLRAELGVPPDRFLIGLIGRFIRDKGQDSAIDALSRLSVPAHLALIGDHETAWGRDIRLRSQSAPARDRIHFVGFRDDVREQLADLDLLVAPSRREALSLALIEAASAGVPVVASRIGGTPEVVRDGETGILVAPQDPASLARAIETLITDPALRMRLGRAARRRYEDHFSLQPMLDATEEVYHSLLAEPHSPGLARSV